MTPEQLYHFYYTDINLKQDEQDGKIRIIKPIFEQFVNRCLIVGYILFIVIIPGLFMYYNQSQWLWIGWIAFAILIYPLSIYGPYSVQYTHKDQPILAYVYKRILILNKLKEQGYFNNSIHANKQILHELINLCSMKVAKYRPNKRYDQLLALIGVLVTIYLELSSFKLQIIVICYTLIIGGGIWLIAIYMPSISNQKTYKNYKHLIESLRYIVHNYQLLNGDISLLKQHMIKEGMQEVKRWESTKEYRFTVCLWQLTQRLRKHTVRLFTRQDTQM